MIEYKNTEYHKQVFYRLTALWVICEAFAGGIMHGIKLPFTGLIISSLAVTCIMLIAYHVPSGTPVLKATIIVAVFKLMLSPHSPPTAYIAVFFQGFMGQLLLSNRRYFKAGAIILATLSLVESAVQRLLVLVIVYGNNLWKATDLFIQKLVNGKTAEHYSFMIAGTYVILHAVIGLFIGLFAYKLVRSSENWRTANPSYLVGKDDKMPEDIFQHKQPKNKFRWIYLLTWIFLVIMLLISLFYPEHDLLPKGIIAGMLLRSVLIILSWNLFFSPMIMKFLKKILLKQQQKQSSEINEVFIFIPRTKTIFLRSLELSAGAKGLSRLKLFLKVLLINILAEQ